MEAGQRGELEQGDDEARRSAARSVFDALAARLHRETHPLIRTKFPSPERIPYYNLIRERAAAIASDRAPAGPRLDRGRDRHAPVPEVRFESADGIIVGRPDLLDIDGGEVVDYKTGQVSDTDVYQVSDREARQLNLYAYLAGQAGVAVTKGTIVRGNGTAAAIEIVPEGAEAEAGRARNALSEFNASIDEGRSFSDLASPSPDVCKFCPCIPLCEPFWRKAQASWREACGCHLEGVVQTVERASVQGTDLLTIEVEARRGTIPDGDASIEQIPTAWVVADGDRCPEVGDTVRLVDARLVSEEPAVLRADRVMTSLWRQGDGP